MELHVKKKIWKEFLVWFPYIILLWGLGTCTIIGASTENGSGTGAGAGKKGFTNPTSLALDPVRTLLLASTLDGSLTALGQRSGDIRWITRDEPMIKVPSDGQNNSPYFLPDPRSGSLYLLGGKGQLKKLPFTIPELVSKAPCRSSQGLLYTGKKMDFWLSLDPITGEKSEVVSLDTSSCPAGAGGEDSKDSTSGDKNQPKVEKLLLGKSEYIISMIDGGKKWNISFHDYSSVDMNPEMLQEYGLIHFTSPSSGSLLTYEKATGELLWETSLSSPIIAIYSIDLDMKNLLSIPFTSVASETLSRLKAPTTPRPTSPLLPTLYIGECPYGLYAVSSLVDDTVLTITSSAYGYPLLEGPGAAKSQQQNEEREPPINHKRDPLHIDTESGTKGTDSFVLIGHYELQDLATNTPPMNQITGSSSTGTGIDNTSSSTLPDQNMTVQQPPPLPIDILNSAQGPSSPSSVKIPPAPTIHVQTQTQPSSLNQFPPPRSKEHRETPNAILLGATIVLALLVTLGIGYYLAGFKKFQWKRPGGQSVRYLSGDNKKVTVGKISYDTTSILGKGCDGTFVYRGTFESRDVAVKRLLPQCYEYADREVDLLKESDQHPNVIRYFCTEMDEQFRYIALELCAATLHDWVEGNFAHEGVDPMKVLQEATHGLAYLHQLRIVHRDIKPANVLLSVCPSSNTVKTMISDFGLCKKLAIDRVSFSRRSGGIPGTDGWIAPEMLSDSTNVGIRTTHAVDVFSLGCVYYYVLTQGSHPFGNTYNRQSNIVSGKYDLENEKVQNCPQGAGELIEAMIYYDSTKRPPLSAILEHPIFWNPDKVLSFFLDVSDRVEKEEEKNCRVLKLLENEGFRVVRGDWRDHICDEVKNDLRKYRTYKGHSVRDLLRALRNKKNHYRELTEEAQKSLGHIPDQFVAYWINRFPNLLPYTWRKFELIKSEPIFSKYYPESYSWSSDDDLAEETEDSALDSDWRSSPDADTDWRNSSSPVRERQNKADKPFWRPNSQYKYNKNKWRKPNNSQNSPPNENVPGRQPHSQSTVSPSFRPPPGLEHIMKQPHTGF